MINISENDKRIWKSDSVHKDIIIRFPGKGITLGNEDILAEAFELTESIEDSEQLSFTGCFASQIKFDCATFEEDVRKLVGVVRLIGSFGVIFTADIFARVVKEGDSAYLFDFFYNGFIVAVNTHSCLTVFLPLFHKFISIFLNIFYI